MKVGTLEICHKPFIQVIFLIFVLYFGVIYTYSKPHIYISLTCILRGMDQNSIVH